jgi:hypothetical protein
MRKIEKQRIKIERNIEQCILNENKIGLKYWTNLYLKNKMNKNE